ncbi:MAG: hypothetical protein D6732_28555, partial [Methanobacteriota archaeon]
PGGVAHFGEFVPAGIGHQAGGAEVVGEQVAQVAVHAHGDPLCAGIVVLGLAVAVGSVGLTIAVFFISI